MIRCVIGDGLEQNKRRVKEDNQLAGSVTQGRVMRAGSRWRRKTPLQETFRM